MLKNKKWMRIAAAFGLAAAMVCAEPFAALSVKAEEVSLLAAEGSVGINLSVTYGQTEARSILSMINEMRTSETDAWYWNESNTEKVAAGSLEPLVYDYDLEAAMKRAAEIALSYSHTRPNGSRCFTAYTIQDAGYKGENIAAGYTGADAVNRGWREDNKDYSGQGHRRNMLDPNFNCVGIGHVYFNGIHYWVEEFAGRSTPNTSDSGVNNNTQTVTIDALSSRITGVSVDFDKTNYELKTGETADFSVTSKISYDDHWGNDIVVTDTPGISVSDSTVAQVLGNTITALKEGTTDLQVSLYDMNGISKAKITVSDTTAATGVTLNQNKLTLTTGETAALSATAVPSEAKADFTWSSSNTKVATVNASGVVTAVGEGSATITVKDSSNSKVSATCTVTVAKKEVKATGVRLNKTTIGLTAGETAVLSATAVPSGAKADFTWSSSNTKVATVNASGVVTAVGEGSATITVKDSSNSKVSATCTVTVEKKEVKATGVRLNKTTIGLTAGETVALSATAVPSEATADFTWSSSNTKVATVNASGVVTAVGEGSATITVKDSSNSKVSATCTVTVAKKEVKATGVRLNKTTIGLTAGETVALSATAVPSEAKADFTWSSSNTKVATVNASGVVTAVGEGSATITVKDSSNSKVSASCTVTVAKKEDTANKNDTEQKEELPAPAEKGAILTTTAGGRYKVTSTSAAKPTVTFVSTTDSTKKSVTIPATIAIDGVTYRVTAISAKAFANDQNIKKVTIGSNVKNIGKQAFAGCKNLKTITIKTTKLTGKMVGSKAFSGISKKATVKVPKKKYAAYKKLIQAKGAAKTVKFKKL